MNPDIREILERIENKIDGLILDVAKAKGIKPEEAIIRYKLNSYERIEERFRDKNIIQLYLKQNPDIAAVVEKNLSEADKNKEKETLEKIADKLLLDDDVDTESISSDLSE